MAANKLNIDEAKEKIQEIGRVILNLGDALVVGRSYSADLYARSKAEFVQGIGEHLDELHKIVGTLTEGHQQLTRAFDQYAEEHSNVARRF